MYDIGLNGWLGGLGLAGNQPSQLVQLFPNLYTFTKIIMDKQPNIGLLKLPGVF